MIRTWVVEKITSAVTRLFQYWSQRTYYFSYLINPVSPEAPCSDLRNPACPLQEDTR